MRRLSFPLLCIATLGLFGCQTDLAKAGFVDKSEIAERVNEWGFYRDQNNWSGLNSTFLLDGQISVSWFCGPHRTFVELSERLSENNSDILKHQIGPPRVQINGDRALSEVNVTISVRTMTPFGEVDSTTSGRFLDVFVNEAGAWQIRERVAIYEKDRLDPVTSAPIPAAFYDEAAAFPSAIRFLAMALKSKNVSVSQHTVLDKTETLEQIYLRAQNWLNNPMEHDGYLVDCSAD